MEPMLNGRNAVIYGGGGSIGGAVASAFAREGARVFLAGRTPGPLEAVAERIRHQGGTVETALVDATNERAVNEHADDVVAAAGSLDISMNVIQHGDVQGMPMAEMSVADYLRPVATAVETFFLTSQAAARHMMRQRSGVILVFGGSGNPVPGLFLGGLQAAFEAMESMRRQLSSELGSYGIRVLTLRSGGIPETLPQNMEGAGEIADAMIRSTMLGRAATLDDVGNVAAFAASDRAASMTAASLNLSAGALVDR
ncbi:SDR family NAD(P)-dependent oxidoreductase [Arthrobacter yangruifuii]|uniref:SDR family NAD(P)-dependent oxidoreductase n=1 Tax=Arthrobacter yangruifuii TaxID=2606616 RepID=UPI001AEEC45E|nr:SDR family oxidoreductase [Arthrobacter yangruifuii]